MNSSAGSNEWVLKGAEQLSLTTAQEEQYYFSGAVDEVPPEEPAALPPGSYRVVAGVLYRIAPGVPPRHSVEA